MSMGSQWQSSPATYLQQYFQKSKNRIWKGNLSIVFSSRYTNDGCTGQKKQSGQQPRNRKMPIGCRQLWGVRYCSSRKQPTITMKSRSNTVCLCCVVTATLHPWSQSARTKFNP